MSAPIHIFIAYSREDTSYLKKLRKYLRQVERKQNIHIWYDGEIIPGTEWEQSIKTHLYQADIILLLMSANALNSDFFYEQEMKKALTQHRSGKSIVIPIILSYCDWNDSDLQLTNLQALPKDGIPIIAWQHESEAYSNIAREIRKSIQLVKTKHQTATLAGQREKEGKKKARLRALQKQQLEEEREQQTATTKEKPEKTTVQPFLQSNTGEQKTEGISPPMAKVDKKNRSSFAKIGIGVVALLSLLFWIIFNFTGMSEEEKAIQKLVDDMVLVKGGTFTMGCLPERDGKCRNNELPPHQVTLSDYQIGKYEVTQLQWKAVMGENPSHFSDCDDCPVEQVDWNDIQDFLQKLNQLTGNNFRLPTEAEWEFAARGGSKSKGYKYAGGNELDEVAWNSKNSESKTHSIGRKKPNELGLCDMSGNVWEWCSDWYASDYYANSPDENPQEASPSSNRVLRGGSWYYATNICRAANRIRYNTTSQNNFIGFRCAKTP